MTKKTLFSLFILLFMGSLCAAPKGNYFIKQPQHIFVNNRILAKVNGKPISVVDVMKKMDLFFYKQFPQYASSVEARFQFYQVTWQRVLQELVEKELIKADAEEVKLPISQGDIRQEIETLFGPNIIANLDKAGLTYEEAVEMIREDLLIKCMMMARVNTKVVRSITPQMVSEYYREWSKENAKPAQWTYQVVSIRGEDSTVCAEVANTAYHQLVDERLPMSQLKTKLMLDDQTTCTLSDEFTHSPKEVSEAYKTILKNLKPKTFSQPIAQKSRSSNTEVYRIFFLKEVTDGGAPPFHQVENKLKDILIENEIQKENEAYITRLRKHFKVHMDEINKYIPEDFKPFALK